MSFDYPSQVLNILIHSVNVVLYRIKHIEPFKFLSIINSRLNCLILYFESLSLLTDFVHRPFNLIHLHHQLV